MVAIKIYINNNNKFKASVDDIEIDMTKIINVDYENKYVKIIPQYKYYERYIMNIFDSDRLSNNGCAMQKIPFEFFNNSAYYIIYGDFLINDLVRISSNKKRKFNV